MGETAGGLPWTDAQWKIVNDAVSEHFGKAGVASQILPCYGPLGSSIESVRKEVLSRADKEVTVADDETIKLFNLRVLVRLSSQQVADESLSSALLAFRRAANQLAQAQDTVVFNGYKDGDLPNAFASGPDSLAGLAAVGNVVSNDKTIANDKNVEKVLVATIAEAVAELEAKTQVGPFACVLGSKVFTVAYTPTDSMVLPADRILPLLQGPLARAGKLDEKQGIVISLGGGGIDIVVATPPKAQFLQIDAEAKYVFRVYVRFILRVKDKIPTTTPGVYTFTVK